MSCYIAPILITAGLLAVALFLLVHGQPLGALCFVVLAAFGIAEIVATAAHNRYMRRFGG